MVVHYRYRGSGTDSSPHLLRMLSGPSNRITIPSYPIIDQREGVVAEYLYVCAFVQRCHIATRERWANAGE